MPQPRNPKAVRPRIKDARAFDQALRKAWLDPFISDMQRRLAQAQGVNQAYAAMNAGVAALQAQPVSGIPLHMVISAMRGVEGYNRAKMFKAFRSALSVDIRLFLTDATVQAHMTQALATNVELIKTIPPRLHESLRKRIAEAFLDEPFNQQRLSQLLAQEYKSSGYNLRRLTRDITQKANADLNQLRQQQVGVTHYIWRTSEDERVRPTHEENNGKTFAWASPPLATGHPGNDVQCRCSSEPQIDSANRARLQGG